MNLEDLANVAFSDIRKIFADGLPLGLEDLPEGIAPAVEHILMSEIFDVDGNRRVIYQCQLRDKVAALEQLANLLGMYQLDAGE